MKHILLADIPSNLLPIINNKGEECLHLNDHPITSIFIFKNRYRVIANGEYRFDLDTETELEVY